MLRCLLRFTIGLVWAWCCAGGAQAVSVVIVSSESNPSYTATADAVAVELERGGLPRTDIVLRLASEMGNPNTLETTASRVFIVLGTDALKQVLMRDLRVPVIAALIPRSGFERVAKEVGKKAQLSSTALYLDQPLGRQLDLLRLALPEVRRVGVLWGPESVGQQLAMGAALAARGLQEVSGTVDGGGSLFTALKSALDDADALLAVADPQVFNSTTIANILLATYRARVPVLAFSPAYVKAGALLSLHTTPAQIGMQAAMMARTVLQGGTLPPHQYPVEFTVSVNEHVARSLGLKLDGVALTERLRRQESRP